ARMWTWRDVGRLAVRGSGRRVVSNGAMSTVWRPVTTSLAACCAVAALIAGCVERKERITVFDDGFVEIVIEATGDSFEELEGPDPLPAPFAGWLVEFGEREDERGNLLHLYTASRLFGPREPLPSNWALPSSAIASSAISFPTTVSVEQRRDGTWYHFRRVYEASSWAPLEALRRRTLDGPLAALEDADPTALSPEQRQLAQTA